MAKGKFIVVEGGEGSGKTGAINTIMAVISKTKGDTIRTREPGGTPDAERIRNILIVSESGYDPVANALLFAAARRDHLQKLILPSLENGKHVVCDRFMLSTLALQGYGEGLDIPFINKLHADTADGIYPDLTVILDIDPEIGLKRSKKRLTEMQSNEDRFENYDLSFHRRVRQGFLEYDLSPSIVIDASQPQEEVLRQVAKKVKDSLSLD